MTPCEFKLEVVPGQTGFHTGRPRYRVECRTCNVLVHEATTGLDTRVNEHLRDVARGELVPELPPALVVHSADGLKHWNVGLRGIDEFYSEVVLAYLRDRAGADGAFVHHNKPDEFTAGCPACGCSSYFAFCDHSGPGSNPDDVFECAACGAMSTRRDHYGAAAWAAQEDDG